MSPSVQSEPRKASKPPHRQLLGAIFLGIPFVGAVASLVVSAGFKSAAVAIPTAAILAVLVSTLGFIVIRARSK